MRRPEASTAGKRLGAGSGDGGEVDGGARAVERVGRGGKMARGKKRKRSVRRGRSSRRPRSDEEVMKDVVSDATAVYGCSASTAREFGGACEQQCDESDLDVRFARGAHALWSAQGGRAAELVQVLEELVSERVRQLAVMEELGRRFAKLSAEGVSHEHLELGDLEREQVRRAVYPELYESGGGVEG